MPRASGRPVCSEATSNGLPLTPRGLSTTFTRLVSPLATSPLPPIERMLSTLTEASPPPAWSPPLDPAPPPPSHTSVPDVPDQDWSIRQRAAAVESDPGPALGPAVSTLRAWEEEYDERTIRVEMVQEVRHIELHPQYDRTMSSGWCS